MSVCPHCHLHDCEQHFYQLLAWEHEYQLQEMHHLLVLCYYLQHPDRYSSYGLPFALGMLVEFVETDLSPAAMRQRIQQIVASDQRQHLITARSNDQGTYLHPIKWTMTAADVTSAGVPDYYLSVRRWAEAMVQDLRLSGNL